MEANVLLLPEIMMNVLSFESAKVLDKKEYKQERCGMLRLSTVNKNWRHLLLSQVHHSLSLVVQPNMNRTLHLLKLVSSLRLVITCTTSAQDVLDALEALDSRIDTTLEVTISNSNWDDIVLQKVMKWITSHEKQFALLKLDLQNCPFLKKPKVPSILRSIQLKCCPRLLEIGCLSPTCERLGLVEVNECASFTDEGVEKLFMQYVNIEKAAFRSCGQLRHPEIRSSSLKEIEFQLCKQLSDVCIELLVQNCAQLQSLSMSQCPKLNPSLSSSQLQFVSYTSCRRLDWAMVQALCRHCPQLRSLSLQNAPNASSESPPVLESRSLQRLTLNACHGVTDAMLSSTMSQCPKLKDVELLHLPQVSHPCVSNYDLKRLQMQF